MMNKIDFQDFKRIMLYAINNNACIEIEFCVDNYMEFQNAWMGKIVNPNTKKPTFWFGLTPDGTQAYDFDTFEAFISARIFRGKSIEEIWDSISISSLDGGLLEETLPFYLEQEEKSDKP